MAADKPHEPSDRELAMMNAFAASMRTVMDPLFTELAELRAKIAPAAPEAMTADQVHAKMMAALRGQGSDVAAIGLVEVITDCTSDLGAPDKDGTMHGATFDAEVHYKPVLIDAKVVGKTGVPVVKNLLNYRLPAGVERHVKSGGLVPDGMQIEDLSKIASGEVDRAGMGQWLAETFYIADLKRFVGRTLPPHVRPSRAPVAAPAAPPISPVA
jgi:hypothetical protein